VGIKVDITAIAGGFASLPLSRVDIISVMRRGDEDSQSITILENVLVLAADQATHRSDANAMIANTVTVALKPQDCELVSLAQEMGTLRLALRAEGDTDSVNSLGVKGDVIRKRLLAFREGAGKKDREPAKTKSKGTVIDNVPDIEVTKAPEKKSEKTPVKATVVENSNDPPKPTTFTHVVTIYNGDQGRRVAFTVDKNGKLVDDDVAQTELGVTPPVERKQPDRKSPTKPKSS
jgi:Flp pilus assembly protein CpaB